VGLDDTHIYAHVVDASHRNAVEAVEERLFGEMDCCGLTSSTTADQSQSTVGVVGLELEAPPGFEPGVVLKLCLTDRRSA